MTLMTPWASVAFWLALAVMPGEGNSFILGSNTLRTKLIIEVIKPLMDIAAASRVGASNTEPAPAEVPVMSPEVIIVRHVAVTIKEVQQVADIKVEAAGETGGFNDALLGRGSKMTIYSGDSEIQNPE